MKAIWNGAIGFGLVNIPVKIYSATETTKLDLAIHDKSDFSNIKFKRVNEKTGKEIKWESIVKGYFMDDKYLYITASNLMNFILDKANIDENNLNKTISYFENKSKFKEI
jgi:non-homologous end joining protein Ku